MSSWAWRTERRPWITGVSEYGRRPPREDREFRAVDVTIPPEIAAAAVSVGSETDAVLNEAMIDLSRLDAATPPGFGALGGFLLRSESQSSSKIERLYASQDEYARALAGFDAGADALEMANATRATGRLIRAADDGAITEEVVLAAHRELLATNTLHHADAGRFRNVQNWIGGSDFSPRNADYVPPPPDLVGSLMRDLIEFAGRADIHPVAQAAIVHAQFESIHPFTDGNGRIGRALINAVLRRRGAARVTVVPAASVMLADTASYFARLDAYRVGDAEGFVGYLATAVSTAAREALVSLDALRELPDRWRQAARPRRNSADAAILETLLEHPVLSAESAIRATGSPRSSVFAAIDRLVDAGVLAELSGRRRGRVYAAGDVLDEVDRLDERIGRRVRGGAAAGAQRRP